jgi:hypothetical protein
MRQALLVLALPILLIFWRARTKIIHQIQERAFLHRLTRFDFTLESQCFFPYSPCGVRRKTAYQERDDYSISLT